MLPKRLIYPSLDRRFFRATERHITSAKRLHICSERFIVVVGLRKRAAETMGCGAAFANGIFRTRMSSQNGANRLIAAALRDRRAASGDDHSTVKIKNYRSADCVIGGFRDHSIGSARNELLLGLYDQKGHLQYVIPVGIDAKQKQEVGNLRPKKTTTFYGAKRLDPVR